MDTTSHDTVGASTLATPLFMPSSPPSHPDQGESYSPVSTRSFRFSSHGATGADLDDARSPQRRSPKSSRASSLERAANEIDARLAQYTVDFSQFPSNHALDEEPLEELRLPHEDNLSDVGGPDDFTANLEKYLMGEDDTMDHKHFSIDHMERDLFEPELHSDAEHESEPEPELQDELPQPQSQPQIQRQEAKQPQQQEDTQNNSQLHQPAVEDEPEVSGYSEFGPPVDMSTPSHLLRRAGGLGKDITHLENIEEDPDDEMEATTTTPSVRKHKRTSSKNEKDVTEDLRRQIAELKDALRERDEQLERNHRRVLEAASAGEQIKHLQGELQRKSELLEELYAKRSDETLLREQIQLLQKQNQEKESFLQKSTMNASELGTLQKQMSDMQKELQSRSSHPDIDTERLETIAYLRQQLDLAQEQLRKRDATLDETMTKLKEVTTAKEQQLREKNSEIDGLKAQVSDNLLEVEKLERELDRVNQAYETLEERIASLETKNRPLEEKNSTLEADLTRAQSQVTAQENALKAMAADLPLETGNTYTEILELIKDLGQPSVRRTPDPFAKDKLPQDQDTSQDFELKHFHEELLKLQTELAEATSAKTTLELQLTRSQDQATEAQTLIHSIETENTRLTKRADELKSSLDKAQQELSQANEERTRALETITRLKKEQEDLQKATQQQPSPPPSPPTNTHQHQPQSTSTSTTQIQTLQTELTTLRATNTNLQTLLTSTTNRETKLKAHILTLRDRHHTELRAQRTKIEHLESIIATKDETAAAVDERIARSVEKREKEWQRRVDLLLKERERMSRALMWSWGGKEMGSVKENDKENVTVDEKGRKRQAYRYKYATGVDGEVKTKSSQSRSGSKRA
ncbi:hypothetical protein AtubIFM55763_003771 [Aspergillus tubingensis]|nr:hypothetical protein AtubIFM55763_003771 [Aspergillus tubingensis]GLB21400.1 hypothetical protein AtubIFM61612_011360 [Aspergillus tubingensis]